MTRTATIDRSTKETQIKATINLDGTGAYDIETGVGFLDHTGKFPCQHAGLA